MFPVLLTPADSLPRKHPTLLLTRASWRPLLIFFAPLERTSGKDFFSNTQKVIALISVSPQIFLSEIYKERNTDKAFMYLFSGLLQ